MGAKKVSGVRLKQFGITVPEGLYQEMVELIEREKKWDGRVEFGREAIREKVDREHERQREKRVAAHPAAAEVVARTRAT